MNKVKSLGISESLDFYSLTYNNTRETIRKVLENPNYSTNIQKLSKQVKDQKETPLERAIWWIEWILRNPNVNHMRSPVHKLGFFISNSFDIIAFEIAIFVLFIFFAYKLHSFYQRVSSDKAAHNNIKAENHVKQS